MTPLFSPGDWVIDTKRETAPTVFAVIEGLETVYVLESDEGETKISKFIVVRDYNNEVIGFIAGSNEI